MNVHECTCMYSTLLHSTAAGPPLCDSYWPHIVLDTHKTGTNVGVNKKDTDSTARVALGLRKYFTGYNPHDEKRVLFAVLHAKNYILGNGLQVA